MRQQHQSNQTLHGLLLRGQALGSAGACPHPHLTGSHELRRGTAISAITGLLCRHRAVHPEGTGRIARPSCAPFYGVSCSPCLRPSPSFLHVLAQAFHGVAGGQGAHREQGQQQHGGQTLHGTLRVGLQAIVRRPRWTHGRDGALLNARARRSRFGAGRLQSRISVDLPNRLSTRSTASTAVPLRLSSTGLSSMMSSEAMRPLSAIISITSCASR